MSGVTTAAESLQNIFAKLAVALPAGNNGTNLIQAWRSILGGPNRTEWDVIEGLGQILSVLLKLESQIKASRHLKGAMEISALQNVEHFKVLFAVQNFNQPSSNFSTICDQAHLGSLGIIGLSLRSEYSEPLLVEEDIKLIVEKLTEVKTLLLSGDIPLDLRVSLVRHIDAILWWLARPDMLSVQDLFERTGSATTVAVQIENRLAVSNRNHASAEGGIADKVKYALNIIARTLGFAVRHADDIKKLGDVYTGLISGPPN